MVICTSPQLFAACRVLHRQISPRHPPYALTILACVRFTPWPSWLFKISLDLLSFLRYVGKIHINEIFFRIFSSIQFSKSRHLVLRCFPDWVSGWWRWGESNSWPSACKADALPAELHPHSGSMLWRCWFFGMLSFFDGFLFFFVFSLSVWCDLWVRENVVGLTRLELVTSRLSGVRSNQLSYRPIFLCSSRLAFFLLAHEPASIVY